MSSDTLADNFDAYHTAVVQGVPATRLYFVRDDLENCPGTQPACRRSASVVPGDRLIVGKQWNQWMCSYYRSPKGAVTIGWLPVINLLVLAPPVALKPDQWLGEWKNGDSTIEIFPDKNGILTIHGEAFWHGANQVTHYGTLEGPLKKFGNHLLSQSNDTDCQAELALVDNNLFVKDNQRCGGLNVSFRGVYSKMPVKRK